jgi:uncharacterized protein YndB with AHSA1/START domain
LFVERNIVIDAPPERVWRAITVPAELERWYAPGRPWEIPTLAPGAVVRFHNTPDETLVATIAVLDPPRELTLRWHGGPATPEMTTSFRLAPVAGGTRVTIYETGYDNLPGDAGAAHAAQAAEGYTASLAALKAWLEEAMA